MTTRSKKESYVAGYDGAPLVHQIPPEIAEYMDYVRSGDKAFSDEQIKLVRHVRYCFATQDIYVHTAQLEKYLSLQKYFPYSLFPWEVFLFALHCCTYWVGSNLPRWPDLFVMVGRGAGKNGYLAFEDFALLSPYNGIRAYNIDICATSEDQAKTTFDDIYNLLEDNRDKLYNTHYTWNKQEITCLATSSVLRFRTNSPRSKDGLRSGKVDFDEVHEYEDFKNIDVFTTGFGKKPHPRRTFITTNGFVRDGVLDSYLKKSQEILDGIVDDDMGWLPFICRLDDEKEVDSPALWHKANPSLEYLPNLLTQIRQEYAAYKRGETSLSFLVKRMNIAKTDREVQVTVWDNVLATNKSMPDLTGSACVGGLDFASVSDWAAVGLLFRVGSTRYWIGHAWMCMQSKDIHRIKAPWREWADAGLLTLVNDVEIDPELIAQWFAEKGQLYDIKKIALDNFRLALMRRALKTIGFDADTQNKRVFLCRKTGEMKVAPVIESMFARHEIVWGDNPLMRWATNNTKLMRDETSGNMTFGKIEAKSRKNDPFMALVAAMQIEDVLDVGPAHTAEDIDVWSF